MFSTTNNKDWYLESSTSPHREVNFEEIVSNKTNAFLVIKKTERDEEEQQYDSDDSDDSDDVKKLHYYNYNFEYPQIKYVKPGSLGIFREPSINGIWQVFKDNDHIYSWNTFTKKWEKVSILRNALGRFHNNKSPSRLNKDRKEECFDEMKEQFGKYLLQNWPKKDSSKGGKKSKKSRKPVKKHRKTRKHKK
jgi:hypothetical protein